jgi:hypothetical protein
MIGVPTPSQVATWPAPNQHPYTKASTIKTTEITFSIIVTIVVILRFYARMIITKAFALDDWVILPAYVGS